MSNTDDKITELLLRWEESLEHGAEVSIDELCRDCPELVEVVKQKINALKEMAWVSTDNESPEDVESDIPRTLADRYQLTERIAVGGFGEVWKAFDPELERHVAVKIPKRLNGQSTDSFLDEARKVASLKHPGIVTVHDVGKENGYTFIVSDLIDGTDLAQKIRSDRPSMPEAIRLVAQAAEHLHFAHEQGFVHRDVKPANILLDKAGKVFIADFGIARTKDESREHSDSYGTLAYMSPEQLAGEHHLVDARTDVYALGVVLFELLTGQHPFSATTPLAMREQILFRQPTPLRKTNSSIPSELEAICLKCLSKHPADRYETAHDLSVELQNAEKSLPFKRFRAIAARLFVIAAVVAGGLFAVSFFSSSTNEQKQESGLTPSTDDSVPTIQMVQNSALHFDGRTRILTPIQQSLPMTIEAWVRTNDNHDMFIVGSNDPGKYGLGLQVNRLIVSAEYVSGGVHAPRAIVPNQWQHVAAVYDNTSTNLFVNGKLVAKGPASELSGTTPFVIGNLGEPMLGQFFNGDIRSIRISEGVRYTTEFSPEDVLLSDTSAVLVYDVSSFDGHKIIDLSGKENHGVIQQLTINSIPSLPQNALSRTKDSVVFRDEAQDGFVTDGVFNFDGQTRILTPLERFAPVTIEAWVHASHNGYVIGSDVPNEWGIGFMLENSKVLVEYVRGSFVSERVYNSKGWCHIAVVFSLTETVVYADGTEIGRGPPTLDEGGTPFVIGCVGQISPALLLIGKIRSVRVTSGVRYESGFTPPTEFVKDSGTRLIYDGNHVQGNQVVDLSGEENHGTVQRLQAIEGNGQLETQP